MTPVPIRTSMLALAAAALMTATGCGEDSLNNPDTNNPTAMMDAAETIATDVGLESGGLLDDVNDLIIFASSGTRFDSKGDALALAAGVRSSVLQSASYDPIAGEWTIELSRERGTLGGLPYARVQRTFKVQFLDREGHPQIHYDVSGRLASTIQLQLIAASGEHRTGRLDQELGSLSGTLVATGTDTDVVTINGSYSRSAVSELTTWNAVRTLDHSIDIQVADLAGPIGFEGAPALAVSGSISGTYHALVSVQRGDVYSDRTIDRSFSIAVEAGEGTVRIGNEGFAFDPSSGALR